VGADPVWVYWVAGGTAVILLIYLLAALFKAEDMA
jgi:K+-transporting ATPase KdpF subunit